MTISPNLEPKPETPIQPKDIWLHPIHFFSFGFGSGLAPRAPGTFGTLAGIPIYLLAIQLPLSAYLLITLLFTIVGVWCCERTSRALGVHDHGAIVWDEIVGLLITLAVVPFSLLNLLLGFALFRLFDIWKPWPIGWADQRVHGGLGIMLDDILAGIYAGLFLFLQATMLT